MLEAIILGFIQGVAEWIPISSEGAIIAVKNTFFPDGQTLSELIRLALFLHLGTFLAALIYFRKDVWQLLKHLFQPKNSTEENKKVFNFLLIATLISGLLGFALLQLVGHFEEKLKVGSAVINLLIAGMLLITAFLQLKKKENGLREAEDLKLSDGIILGLAQSFAVIPGLSRSGLTVSTLLLGKFNDTVALRLSFLLSMPIVLAGNLALNLEFFNFSTNSVFALIASFLVGILTIDLLLKLAKKINFGYFALFFATLLIVSILF